MATLGQWVQGARPRTLPAAIAPVLVGTAIAWYYLARRPARSTLTRRRRTGSATAGARAARRRRLLERRSSPTGAARRPGRQFALRALLALVVALALQVGVNYANDYSDGIRGTDDVRVGPVRLVGQRLATPRAVKLAGVRVLRRRRARRPRARAAHRRRGGCCSSAPPRIVAAWFYTGGPSPYGYAGLGELFVFVFFGLVAVVGHDVRADAAHLRGCALAGGVGVRRAVGARSCSPTTCATSPPTPSSGKRTLAVRLGDHGHAGGLPSSRSRRRSS